MTHSYTFEPHVRLRDIDRNGHVNHPVYAEYLGETRAGYYRDVIGVDMSDADTVIVHLSVDYLHPVAYGDHVIVEVYVDELGESSISMEYAVVDDVGCRYATARTVQVVSNDEETGIPDCWRDKICDYERAERGVEVDS